MHGAGSDWVISRQNADYSGEQDGIAEFSSDFSGCYHAATSI
jgi:hypothetical protein